MTNYVVLLLLDQIFFTWVVFFFFLIGIWLESITGTYRPVSKNALFQQQVANLLEIIKILFLWIIDLELQYISSYHPEFDVQRIFLLHDNTVMQFIKRKK